MSGYDIDGILPGSSGGGGGGEGAWTNGQIATLLGNTAGTNTRLDTVNANLDQIEAATEAALLPTDVDPIIVEDGTGGAATTTLYGWTLQNDGEVAATITIEFESGTFQAAIVNLAVGESVTYLLPEPIAATTVQFDSTGVTGTLFVDLAA